MLGNTLDSHSAHSGQANIKEYGAALFCVLCALRALRRLSELMHVVQRLLALIEETEE